MEKKFRGEQLPKTLPAPSQKHNGPFLSYVTIFYVTDPKGVPRHFAF